MQKERQPNGEITRGELKPRLLMWTAKGIIKKNTCKTDASTCAFGTSKGTYKEGACPDCGQVHVDLRTKLTFKSQAKGSTNCGDIARGIIESGQSVSCGFSAGNNGTYFQLAIENEEHDQILYNMEESKSAIKYLDNALEKGYAVRVGINHTLRKDKTNNKNINEKTTDHFVVIVGKKCITGKINYIYWDVGTSRGESTEWVFELREGYKLISDNTYKSGNKPYILTQIAKVTKLNDRFSLLKTLNILILLFFLISCSKKSNLMNYELNEKTIVEILENHDDGRINFIPCAVSQTYYKFKKDTIYFQPHMDSEMYYIINKIVQDSNRISFITTYKDTITFLKTDSITWLNPDYYDNRSNYKTIYMDTLYLNTIKYKEEPCIDCFEKEMCDEWARQEKERNERPFYVKKWQGAYSFRFGRTHMGESSKGGMRFHINGENSYYSYYSKHLNPDTGEVIDSSKQDNITIKIVKATKDTLELQESDSDIYKIHKNEQGNFNVSGHPIYMLSPPNESYLLTKEK